MSDERERLFQLFHDLVDEALVQYADGFAVDLESRYYELADTLIAERAALEQQLAQAQAEHEELAADKHFLLLRNDALQAEQATMRALLADLIEVEDDDPGCTTGDPEESSCFFCEGYQDFDYKPSPAVSPWRKAYHHRTDCAWVRTLAFFEAHPPMS